jgi:HAD superfamily hydrolase (TIGR01509 family)
MYDLIIFDLDGVLIDSKEVHYKALNMALSEVDERYTITTEEHLKIYDGLPTRKKLSLLNEQKGLPNEYFDNIWQRKQEITVDLLKSIEKNDFLIKNFELLKSKNKLLACASNSISSTVDIILEQLGILKYFDLVLSNESVNFPKPHPEMYWKTMLEMKVFPEKTVIIEDSPIGRIAAKNSGANTMFVQNSTDLTNEFFEDLLTGKHSAYNNYMYQNNKLNILIPMAGKGSRFADKGYVFPKPLVEIKGKPMIQLVIENLNIDANYIFIVQKEHVEKYNIKQMLEILKPGCTVIELDEVTEGAAVTTLLAKEFINNGSPLLLANSDQYIEWDSSEVMYNFLNSDIDGGILTFDSTHPKWSYAKVDENNFVTEVAEKNPISNNATVGIYFWKKGSDYVKYAEEMINKDIRVNGEFYVCPVFNEAISDTRKIKIKNIDEMWGIGTPEDLDNFLNLKYRQ